MSFSGKIVLVTGGASGIGAATARVFGQEGAHVLIVDRDVDKANEIVDKIRGTGGTASFYEVDLADAENIAACCAKVRADFDRLDVMVNNAGIVQRAPIAETGDADWHPQIDINLRAPALMAKGLLPLLKASEYASIINISSEGGYRARRDHWVYDATKAGISALTRAMAVEFAPFGIRANAIAPGWIVTEMHFGDAPDPEARKQEMLAMENRGCLMNRLGRPEEIADAVLFLASKRASYITGTVLHVDGGLVMR